MKDFKLEENIQLVPPDSLIPYAKNAKAHSIDQIDKIANQIAGVGFTQPIVVDQNNVIIAGHGRHQAAIKLGLQEVPVVKMTHLTDDEVIAYRIADNRVAEAPWNLDQLKFDLGTLDAHGFNLEMTGFSLPELGDFLKSGLLPEEAFEPRVLGTEFAEVEKNNENLSEEELYTKKIECPIYTPKGEKPLIGELYNIEKTTKLLEEIEQADIPEAIKDFLRLASNRHTVFNYEKIAEYYSHAPKDVQHLMEKSALVIIDFKKAIEEGFVKLSKEIAENYLDAQ